MAKNPYSILGVSENATDDEIRIAYRKLAKQYHPDLNPNDATAGQKMNELNAAYEQIKTAEKRAAYKAEQAQNSYYHSNAQDPFTYYYHYNGYNNQTNGQQYYQSGNGYYGGSYTGKTGDDEPPFGWDSIFGSENTRREFYTFQFKLYRILRFLFIGFMLLSIARCVCAPIFYAEETSSSDFRVASGSEFTEHDSANMQSNQGVPYEY